MKSSPILYGILVIILSSLLWQCQEDKLDMDGHWHLYKYPDQENKVKYHVLELQNDTGHLNRNNIGLDLSASINKEYNFLRLIRIEYGRFYHDIQFITKDSIVLRNVDFDVTYDEKLEKSIYKNKTITDIVYTGHRCNEKCCTKEEDFFSTRLLNIDLPFNKNTSIYEMDMWDSIVPNNYRMNRTNVCIGQLKFSNDTTFFINGHVENHPKFNLFEHLREEVTLYIDKKAPMKTVFDFIHKLQKIDEVQKIYFANQTPTQPNESYKVGWIPLTSNYPKWNNLIYEEWIKLYHRQLERDLSD